MRRHHGCGWPPLCGLVLLVAIAASPTCCGYGGCPDPAAGVLAVHNAKRLLHQSTAELTWSSTLAASAQVQRTCKEA